MLLLWHYRHNLGTDRTINISFCFLSDYFRSILSKELFSSSKSTFSHSVEKRHLSSFIMTSKTDLGIENSSYPLLNAQNYSQVDKCIINEEKNRNFIRVLLIMHMLFKYCSNFSSSKCFIYLYLQALKI